MKKFATDLRHHIQLFSELPDEDYARLLPLLHRAHGTAGKILMRADDDCGKVMFILRGIVHVVGETENGAPKVLNACGAGETLGEMNAIDPQGHSASVVAIEKCDILWMSSADFRSCALSMARLSFNIAVMQTQRLRRATKKDAVMSSMKRRGAFATFSSR